MMSAMVFRAILGLIALSGCSAQTAPAKTVAPTDAGWSIESVGDLNLLFDCLADKNIALVAAHRGGPRPGYPENAIETFERTLSETPAFIEADVATSSDGVLYLMHDDTLDRTTTGDGPTDASAWADIATLQLEDWRGEATAFHPPTFAGALEWAKGRTILEIDFKKTTKYEDVIAEIDRQNAADRVILIAYSLAQARRLHRLAPATMISLSLASQSDLNRAVAGGVPADRLLGFTGVESPDPRLFSVLNNADVEVIFGTLGGQASLDDKAKAGGDALYAELASDGVDIIATDRPLAAHRALVAAKRGATAGQCGITNQRQEQS